MRIISVGKDNVWRKFGSLDLFTRLLIITLLLLAIATPFIVYNYQLFKARGDSETERLQTIQQLQQDQENFRNAIAKAPMISTTPNTVINQTNPAGKFNLIDAIQQIIINITQIFQK